MVCHIQKLIRHILVRPTVCTWRYKSSKGGGIKLCDREEKINLAYTRRELEARLVDMHRWDDSLRKWADRMYKRDIKLAAWEKELQERERYLPERSLTREWGRVGV